MADLNFVNELLVHTLLDNVIVKDSRTFVRLKENGIQAKLRKVDLYDVPSDSLLLKLDSYQQPLTLFDGKKGERKRCDYILITHLEERDILLFIELKSGSCKSTEIKQQFKGSQCVIDYCNSALNHFYSQNNYFDSFDKHFVVFYKSSSISKRVTRHKSPLVKVIDRDNPSFQYSKYPNPFNPCLKDIVR